MSNDDDKGSIQNDAKLESRISKQDFLNQVFGEVGTFIKDYHCVLGGKIVQYGRIYATDRFLIFYSKIFGREKKIMVHFSQIMSITQSTGVFRSIIVETAHRSYNFHGFWEPDKSFYYLKEAFERFKASNSDKPSPKDVVPVEVEDEFDEPEYTISCAEDIALLSKLHKKVRVIKDTILPINLNDFLATFVEDSAVHSYQKYHELVNDRDIETSPWIECGANEYQRELKFTKAVNLPGLVATRGVKYQQLRRSNECGFILTSSTRLEDVPCADCFSVDDVLVVHAEGTQAISVNISFEVAFAKSTLMRSFIEGPTEREMKKWLEAFFDYVLDIVVNKKGLVRGKRSSTTASNNPNMVDASTAEAHINSLTRDAPSTTMSVDSVDVNASAQDASGVSRTASTASNPPSSITASNHSIDGRSTAQTDRDVPVNKANETKQEFLYSLFGPKAGILYKDYHCALVGTILIQGRIYATDKAILFYSIIFGREKALMIPFSQIKNISHPQGVLRSIVIDTDSKSYTFRSFWEPEKSFHSLEVAWEKAKQLQKATPEINDVNNEKRRFSIIDALPDDSPDPLDMLILNEQNEKVSLEKYALDTALQEKVDTGEPLLISLEEFLSMFINDDAPYGYDHFYESMNNATPSVSAWSEIKPGEYQREIRFLAPTSFIAFGNSRGVKSQYRVNLCDNGMIVKSSTHLEDVSFSTYFTIEEVMLVHRGNTNNSDLGGDSVVVHLSFDIQLLKGSFVRPLVVSVTAPELRRWLESYINYMRDSVNQKKSLSPKKTSNASSSPRHKSSNNECLSISGMDPTNSQQESFGHNFSNSINNHPTGVNSSTNDAPVCDMSKKSCPISNILQESDSRVQSVAGDKDKANAESTEALVTAVAHQYRLLILLYCTITLCFFLLAILIWNRNQVHALHKKVLRIEELLEMLIKQELDSSHARRSK